MVEYRTPDPGDCPFGGFRCADEGSWAMKGLDYPNHDQFLGIDFYSFRTKVESHLIQDIYDLWGALLSAISRVTVDDEEGYRLKDHFMQHAHHDMLQAIFRSFEVQSGEYIGWIRASINRWSRDLEMVDADTDPEYVRGVVLHLPSSLLGHVEYSIEEEGGREAFGYEPLLAQPMRVGPQVTYDFRKISDDEICGLQYQIAA